MAKQQSSQGAADFAAFYKSFFLDLPVASVKWGLGSGEEKAAAEAAWNGYDAGVRLATAAVDALYQNQLFSEVFSRTVSTTLRWQQIGNAVGGAVLTSFWNALGVPTTTEVQGLSEQIRALESRLSQVANKKDVQMLLDQLRAFDTRLHRAAPTPLRTNHHAERAAA